jgi:Domain of unknown function (DUF6456)
MSATTPRMSGSLPLEATFVWREGRWHVQAGHAENLRPASPVLQKLLAQAKAAGTLIEAAPGLFRYCGSATKPLRDSHESPLQRLAQLRQVDGQPVLDMEQVKAGERLRRDYEAAHMSPRVTASYDPSQAMGSRDRQMSDNHIAALSDASLAAREKVHCALDAVGPELSGIMLHVCCMAAGLEQAELRLNLPRRAGKAVLQLALTRLARHYGLKTPIRHGGPSRIGHWAAADFRPAFPAPGGHQP